MVAVRAVSREFEKQATLTYSREGAGPVALGVAAILGRTADGSGVLLHAYYGTQEAKIKQPAPQTGALPRRGERTRCRSAGQPA